MEVDLRGRVAFVTGAAGAIGQATARRMAACGAAVVVADVNGEGAEKVAAELPRAIGVAVDIRDADAVEAAVEATLKSFGRLDILVNNAGVNTFRDRVDIDAFPVEEWHRIVSIDLDGLFLVSKAAARPMIDQGGGRIVNVASVVGVDGDAVAECFRGGEGGGHSSDAGDGAGAGAEGDPGQLDRAGVGDDGGDAAAVLWRGRLVPGANR